MVVDTLIPLKETPVPQEPFISTQPRPSDHPGPAEVWARENAELILARRARVREHGTLLGDLQVLDLSEGADP